MRVCVHVRLCVCALPCLVHQVSSPCFVIIQVLLELVVDGSRIVLQTEGENEQFLCQQIHKSEKMCVRDKQKTCQPKSCAFHAAVCARMTT